MKPPLEILLSLVFALLVVAPALADSAERASSEAAMAEQPLPAFSLVIVQDRPSAPPPASLEARVLSWFSADTAKLASRRSARLDTGAVLLGPDLPGVEVWLMARGSTSLRLFFSVKHRRGGPARYLMTDHALGSVFDELGSEQLAQLIYLSASALWEGNLETGRREIERGLSETVPAAPSSVVPAAFRASAPQATSPRAVAQAAAEPARFFARTGLDYAVRLRGEEGAAHGPGAFVGALTRSSTWQLGGRARAQLLLPRAVEKQRLRLDTRGYSFRGGPWVARRLSKSWWSSAELGAGVDVIRYAADAKDDTRWLPNPPETELRPLVTLGLGIQAELGFLRLGVLAELSAQLLRTRYEVVEASGHVTWLTPWVVQPGLVSEVAW